MTPIEPLPTRTKSASQNDVAGLRRRAENHGQGGDQARGDSAHARRERRRRERLEKLAAPWWKRYPKVVAAEVRALEAAGFRVTRLMSPVHGLVLQCERSGEHYLIRFEQDYGAGGLLIAYPDVDHADASGGHRTLRVAYGYGPRGSVRALESLIAGGGEYVPSLGGGVLLPPAWRTLEDGTFGSITFGVSRSGRAFTLRELTGAANAKALGKNSSPFARAFPVPLKGLWTTGTWLPQTAHPTEAVVRDAEKQLARAHGLKVRAVRARLQSEIAAIAVPFGGTQVDWHFVRRSRAGMPMLLPTEPYWSGSFVDRAPFATLLTGLSVAIVGCGSVGWSVATLLARSGVRHFTLFDNDHVHSGNLARVGGFLDSAGRFKVDVLAEQLEAIAPGIEVRARAMDVGTTAGTTQLVATLPDLLINLTGEELSTDETNLAALLMDCPAIFAWVSMGVTAGRIFRVRPGKSACYECVREAEPEPIPSRGLASAYGATAWPGSVLDTTAFAAAVARSAVLTLIDEPVSPRNPDHTVLTFGGLAPTTELIEIPRDPRCSRCGS